MWTDPVVEEIHQIRQKLLAEVGGDIHVFMAKISAEQAASGRVVLESRRLPTPPAEEHISAISRQPIGKI